MIRGGYTTRSLGQLMGVSNASVSGWCSGSRPRPEMARRLAEHFGLPVQTLIDDTKPLPPPGWDRLHQLEEQASSEYPENPQAKQERLDALHWRNVLDETNKVTASKLRRMAAELISAAEELEKKPSVSKTKPANKT